MKAVMGWWSFAYRCLPASSRTGLAYETFRISLPFSTGKGHEFVHSYAVVVPGSSMIDLPRARKARPLH
jgi:hypothetical protein